MQPSDACLLASRLAYKSPHDIDVPGVEMIRFFSRAGTQAYLFCIQPYYVLAFRGTEMDSVQDIVTDARFNQITHKDDHEQRIRKNENRATRLAAWASGAAAAAVAMIEILKAKIGFS